MALELKESSAWWYARYSVSGRLHRIKLNVPVQGSRPPSITRGGDAAFERSRGKAQAEHDRVLEEIRSRKTVEERSRRMVEAMTGTEPSRTAIDALADAWAHLPRQRHPTAGHLAHGRAVLNRFSTHMAEHHPAVQELAAVSRDHARGFMDAETERGVSARTWNGTRTILRSVFRHLEPNADAYRG